MSQKLPTVAASLTGVLAFSSLVAIPLMWGRSDESGLGDLGSPVTVTHTKTMAANEPHRGRPQEREAAKPIIEFTQNATGPQATIINLESGEHVGTATERFARPALSLSKLYIAYYVLEYGTEVEKYRALEMIASSDDASAEELYEAYPDSIDEVAQEFDLLSTRGAEQWGWSVTSSYDVAMFIAALVQENPQHPILVAMALSHRVASDGYGQDFGTAVLPDALGTKWGWSDDLSLHSSVTVGQGYVASAAVAGSAEDLTEFVEAQLADLAAAANEG